MSDHPDPMSPRALLAGLIVALSATIIGGIAVHHLTRPTSAQARTASVLQHPSSAERDDGIANPNNVQPPPVDGSSYSERAVPDKSAPKGTSPVALVSTQNQGVSSRLVDDSDKSEPSSEILRPAIETTANINRLEVRLSETGNFEFQVEPFHELVIRFDAPGSGLGPIIHALPHWNRAFSARCFGPTESIPNKIAYKRVEFLARGIAQGSACVVKAEEASLPLSVSYN